MFKKIAPVLFVITVLGAGCFQPVSESEKPEQFGSPSPEGFVSFNEGFGKIPGPAPEMPEKRTSAPAVEWEIDLPSHPTEVTVLRMYRTLPDPAFLQNITTALRIPAGALKSGPTAEAMSIQWRDEDGYRWTYDGGTHRVTFALIEPPETDTVNALPANDSLVGIADDFLNERGVDTRSWSSPGLAFSWNDWWRDVQLDNHCMTFASVAAIRELARDGSLVSPALPALPLKRDVTCALPEFPARHLIRYHLNRDEQEVFDNKGERAAVAELTVNAAANAAESGWFELAEEVDRSNYPSLALKDALENLRNGGLRGTSGYGAQDLITITSFKRGLYRHDVTVDGAIRTYFIPGIYASGDAMRPNGGREPFDTFVPLLREDMYSE
jgi:hypothetical protein